VSDAGADYKQVTVLFAGVVQLMDIAAPVALGDYAFRARTAAWGMQDDATCQDNPSAVSVSQLRRC
jgi:hypothetical protein